MEYKSHNDIPKENLILVSEKMIGIVLRKCLIDSNGNPIDPNAFYKVEKLKTSEELKLIVTPTGENVVHDFINNVMKQNNKLN
jgi:hypothetical protein